MKRLIFLGGVLSVICVDNADGGRPRIARSPYTIRMKDGILLWSCSNSTVNVGGKKIDTRLPHIGYKYKEEAPVLLPPPPPVIAPARVFLPALDEYGMNRFEDFEHFDDDLRSVFILIGSKTKQKTP
jgi:hypothetical protein